MPRKKTTALVTQTAPQQSSYEQDDYEFSYENSDGSMAKGWVSFDFTQHGQSGWPANWWQFAPATPRRESTTAYACKVILAQEVAKLAIHHKKELPSGEIIKVKGSPISSVLRKPNHYQTRSDFFLSLMDTLCFTGNSYSYVERDSRGNISGLHPVCAGATAAYVVPDSGEVFYNISTNPMLLDVATMHPARDVLHIRLLCPRHPLIGETPLVAAALSGALGDAIQSSNLTLMGNQSKPGGVIETDKPLPPAVVEQIKQGWKDVTSGANKGSTPVLTHGLTWKATAMSAVDAEIIALYGLSKQDVASVYRVPLYMLGDMSKMTFNNVETIQRHFYASCLGFYLEHIEISLDALFGLPEDEFIEFDVESGLMRSEMKQRVEALSRGILGGLYSPNEARLWEGLSKVKGGDTVFLQQQMVPIDKAANPPPPVAPKAPVVSPPALAAPPAEPATKPSRKDVDVIDLDHFGLLLEKKVLEGISS